MQDINKSSSYTVYTQTQKTKKKSKEKFFKMYQAAYLGQ